MGADHPEDVRWLTYAEAGRILGIDAASVTRRARRLRWRRQAGNDGKARVAVPTDALPDHPGDMRKNAVKPEALTPDIKPDGRADMLAGMLAAVSARLEQAEAERDAERQACAEATRIAAEATRHAALAEAEAATLRQYRALLEQDLAWRRQPWWVRMLYRKG